MLAEHKQHTVHSTEVPSCVVPVLQNTAGCQICSKYSREKADTAVSEGNLSKKYKLLNVTGHIFVQLNLGSQMSL